MESIRCRCIKRTAETAAALIPLLIILTTATGLPFLMSLAAGAMIYVAMHEIVPEIMSHEYNEAPVTGFFLNLHQCYYLTHS